MNFKFSHWNGFDTASKYCGVASFYSLVRKPFALRGKNVRNDRIESPFDEKLLMVSNQSGRPQYRSLFIKEVIALSILASMIGSYTAPFHVLSDIRTCEDRFKECFYIHNYYRPKLKFESSFDLLLV